ncbi:ribosomal protein L22 [Eremomyces bilateralis CBS 781.70]|uniref:Ribosomal protein L22 n=1 Tax=Eremomyces bilateralis CBS 781.70 TaxID=1392243 RepID=A0A6G1FSB3_9PEZI|nr:ribosomal protein L22 [Eremomyces bilateralis CBS 781.70]KAF1808674.1 ribosomal protein L22 [Eremomyces bilateralis CBS 781.70]
MKLLTKSRQLAHRLPLCQCRAFSLSLSRQYASAKPAPKSPTSSKVKESTKTPSMPEMPTLGDLTATNIFEIDRKERAEIEKQEVKPDINRTAMMAATDPEPWKRRRWERKMVIRDITRRGRMSKGEMLKRTEREHSAKTPMLKTSTKKLMFLARQIAGKPIEEAILQMRFSKKGKAVHVKAFLEYARDQAIVYRGMGLGKVGAEGEPAKEPAKIVIKDKDGTRRKIDDASSIYISQAWVGREPYGTDIDYRGRGRAFRLRLPYARLYVVLKEETTRIRLAAERQRKRDNRTLWTQLPDRPVTGQSQYVLW